MLDLSETIVRKFHLLYFYKISQDFWHLPVPTCYCIDDYIKLTVVKYPAIK